MTPEQWGGRRRHRALARGTPCRGPHDARGMGWPGEVTALAGRDPHERRHNAGMVFEANTTTERPNRPRRPQTGGLAPARAPTVTPPAACCGPLAKSKGTDAPSALPSCATLGAGAALDAGFRRAAGEPTSPRRWSWRWANRGCAGPARNARRAAMSATRRPPDKRYGTGRRSPLWKPATEAGHANPPFAKRAGIRRSARAPGGSRAPPLRGPSRGLRQFPWRGPGLQPSRRRAGRSVLKSSEWLRAASSPTRPKGECGAVAEFECSAGLGHTLEPSPAFRR